MGKTVVFRMNGVRAAFLHSMGDVAMPTVPFGQPTATTSASLVIRRSPLEGGRIEQHVLFDCGEGVVGSLGSFGLHEVTHLFLSHNHLDHIAGLDNLTVTQRFSGGRCPIDTYCTTGTWQDGPLGRFPWLCGAEPTPNPLTVPQEAGAPLLRHCPVTPGQPVELDLGIDLRVTPVAVYHGRSAYEPVIYLVEFGSGETAHRLLLAWDLLHLIPRYPWDDADTAYAGPVTDSTDLLPEHAALFAGVEEMFLEGTFLTPLPHIGHISLDTALRELVTRIRPRRLWLTHYEGALDPMGRLSTEQLVDWVAERRARYSLHDVDIRLAAHGMTLNYAV